MIINENLSYEESELRLIIYQIAVGMSMHLAILAIFISIPIITMENKPRVVTPTIVDYNQYGDQHYIFLLSIFKLLILIICSIFLARGYPTLHLAIIFDDGLVCDFSVKNKTFQDFNTLMKLSKSEQYFGYSDENGVLYFIHSHPR